MAQGVIAVRRRALPAAIWCETRACQTLARQLAIKHRPTSGWKGSSDGLNMLSSGRSILQGQAGTAGSAGSQKQRSPARVLSSPVYADVPPACQKDCKPTASAAAPPAALCFHSASQTHRLFPTIGFITLSVG